MFQAEGIAKVEVLRCGVLKKNKGFTVAGKANTSERIVGTQQVREQEGVSRPCNQVEPGSHLGFYLGC